MAPLRIPYSDYITNEVTDFFNYSTEHPVHETRHHGHHRNHSRQNHTKNPNHFMDILTNSIMEMVNSKYVPENSILPDMETLSSHMENSEKHQLKMNITYNRSDLNFIERDEFLFRHSGPMTAVYCVAYLIVFTLGLVGNSFVIAVVYRSPRMRTVTNFFIVNLAVADILVIIFCLPATLMSNIFVREYLVFFYVIFDLMRSVLIFQMLSMCT